MSPYAPTPRETEVLEALLAGLDARQIAEQLSLSPHTVHHHLAGLRAIYGATSTHELTCLLWARRLAAKDVELEQERLEHRKCQRDLAAVDRRGRVG